MGPGKKWKEWRFKLSFSFISHHILIFKPQESLSFSAEFSVYEKHEASQHSRGQPTFVILCSKSRTVIHFKTFVYCQPNRVQLEFPVQIRSVFNIRLVHKKWKMYENFKIFPIASESFYLRDLCWTHVWNTLFQIVTWVLSR